MADSVKIGLIGDYNSTVKAHAAIPVALSLAAHELNSHLICEWIATESIANDLSDLYGYDGLWCVPASPYKSMEGALNGIRYARENNIPFLGTCGGFQHTVIEYARNVIGIKDADHAESNPDSSVLLITPLQCAMVGLTGKIFIAEGTRASEIFNCGEITEGYHCSYGFNPGFESLFEGYDFRISGRDENKEVKIIEHKNLIFMIATLFQPELSAYKDIVHPLIKSYLSAVLNSK